MMIEADLGAFEKLLAPIKPQDFLHQYWDKKPLYIKGTREKFRDLFSRQAFDQAIGQWSRNRVRDMNVKAAFIDLEGSQQEIEAGQQHINDFLVAGMTICAVSINAVDSKLTAFLAGVKASLNLPAHIIFNCYVSKDEKGFSTHFDGHGVIILQIEGSKRWRFSSTPAVPFPNQNYILPVSGTPYLKGIGPIERPNEKEFEDVLLEEGDVLYLPAGHWHVTSAKEFSLALTFSMQFQKPFDLIFETLRTKLQRNPAWRSTFPPVWNPNMKINEVPSEISNIFESLIQDLKKQLESMDLSEFHRAWYRSVGTITSPIESQYASEIQDTERRENPTVNQNDALKIAGKSPIHYFTSENKNGLGEIFLYYKTAEVKLPIEALPFVKNVLQKKEFKASDVLRWADYDWSEMQPVLTQLLHLGVLERKIK